MMFHFKFCKFKVFTLFKFAFFLFLILVVLYLIFFFLHTIVFFGCLFLIIDAILLEEGILAEDLLFYIITTGVGLIK